MNGKSIYHISVVTIFWDNDNLVLGTEGILLSSEDQARTAMLHNYIIVCSSWHKIPVMWNLSVKTGPVGMNSTSTANYPMQYS